MIFFLGKEYKPRKKNVDLFYTSNGKAHLVAELIPVDEDNCAAIKINGTIALIEIDKVPAQQPGYVDLITTQIHLYPTNV